MQGECFANVIQLVLWLPLAQSHKAQNPQKCPRVLQYMVSSQREHFCLPLLFSKHVAYCRREKQLVCNIDILPFVYKDLMLKKLCKLTSNKNVFQ